MRPPGARSPTLIRNRQRNLAGIGIALRRDAVRGVLFGGGLSIPACPARRSDRRRICSEEEIMHPDITKTIAALRVDEKHIAAAAARQARQARAGRAARSLPLPGSAAAASGRNARRRRLLGRWVPGR